MAADALKQRLVGGATLLLVAVIAWFWLLSADSPVDPVARESQVPAAPDIQPFAVQEPAQPKNIEPIGSARETPPAPPAELAPPSKAVVSAAPPPKPAQNATPPKVDTARINANHSAVGKSNAAAAEALAAAPVSKAVPLKTSPPATKNSEPAVAAKTNPAPAKPADKTAETFQLDQHGLPVAWVVQVGLFSTQAAADKIKATLQGKGFKAYSEPFKSDKASGIKVFVGPKLSRERADAQKKAVDELLKTNTMVVRFVAN
jgi:DedD protein